MSFESFISDISPKNSSQVSISGEMIRKTIEGKSNVVVQSFLTGSYSRHTKIDPIDDLDIFFKFNFGGIALEYIDGGYKIYITESYETHQLNSFLVFSGNRYWVSPIKMINYIGKLVKETYVTTEGQSRSGECYTVKLSSYNLTIDCVPSVKINDDYLIPSGGNDLLWKKTNPKIDKIKIEERNNDFDSKLKGVIKILKYWNKNKNTGIKFKSYLLECLVYYGFGQCTKNMEYLEILNNVVQYIRNNVDQYRNIFDLPRYEYMSYYLLDTQKNRILSKLDDFLEKLDVGEYTTLSYLKE